MRTSGLAAAVGTFPAIDVAVGDAEDDPDVPDDGGLGCKAVEQPVGERAVVEGLVEQLGLVAECGECVGDRAHHRRGVGPLHVIMAPHPFAGCVVLVGVGPGQDEGDFHRLRRERPSLEPPQLHCTVRPAGAGALGRASATGKKRPVSENLRQAVSRSSEVGRTLASALVVASASVPKPGAFRETPTGAV